MEQENNADRRFTSFLQALERISERYGVLIQSIGGVTLLNDDELERLCRVFYIDDLTSGDLLYRIGYWEEIP